MLSKEDNEFACRVGAGTPMGELFRRFWLPAILPGELPQPDGPPVRVRAMDVNTAVDDFDAMIASHGNGLRAGV